MNAARLRGLYAVTPDTAADLCAPVSAALRGGARLVQFRNKSGPSDQRIDQARQLKALCAAAGALFIVNDDIELAHAIGADGVHLGKDDVGISAARTLLGAGAIVGASCYDSLELAAAAAAAGANYLAFGSFFPSRTKPGAVRADPTLLQTAHERFDVPLCAIGGITTMNGGALVAAGADMLAIVDGLFGAPNVEGAAAAYAALWADDRNGCTRP
ncbi:MAG: thiamine phosphate synthase [Xanthomonadaceae bacterium]|nr:thiamine phosphate synthase [Xanthomonadaceae bacterium]